METKVTMHLNCVKRFTGFYHLNPYYEVKGINPNKPVVVFKRTYKENKDD